jgi:uncharacterized oligopeptide transporter (OPT) family protein
MLALEGGILGVLMMVPLRRALIPKEHGVLPYPEGTACADVLIAGERGGALARTVFQGLGVGALWVVLPISTTAPIFAGGLVRAYVERKTGVAEESEVGSGTLFSSGLIAGGSLAGILYAILFGREIIRDPTEVEGLIPAIHDGTGGLIAGGLLFFALAMVRARAGQKKLS